MNNIVPIITALISAITTIIVAFASKNIVAHNKKNEAEQMLRVKESKLLLKMLHANSNLTIGLAMAMKHGKCNGEVEAGLRDVNEANAEYQRFCEEVAIDVIKN